MTTLDPPVSTSAPAAAAALRLAPALFAATAFLSALLLFVVQPMFTKMVLPKLGGAPDGVVGRDGVLPGCAAGRLRLRPSPGAQAAARAWGARPLGVLAAAALTLPIGIAQGFGAPPTSGIALWLIGLLAASIGLPFAVLSASAPLLQGWFAASGHARRATPMFSTRPRTSARSPRCWPIRSRSNRCCRSRSRRALVGRVRRAGHAHRGRQPRRGRGCRMCRPSDATRASTTHARSAAWTALAAIPAGLVIAVTSYITTDIAAAPFLWVLPLALYLLTFVAVFRDRPWISHDTVALAVPLVVAPLAIGLLGGDPVFWLAMMALNLVAFFLLALAVSRRALSTAAGAGAADRVLFLGLVRRRARRRRSRRYSRRFFSTASTNIRYWWRRRFSSFPACSQAAARHLPLRPVRSWRWSRSRLLAPLMFDVGCRQRRNCRSRSCWWRWSP